MLLGLPNQPQAKLHGPEDGDLIMHILCLGLNHKTADLSLRERLAFSEEDLQAALRRLDIQRQRLYSEMVVLSTCNRVELYAVASLEEFDPLEKFISQAKGVPVAEFHGHLYRLSDVRAVEHLLQVASGLDSLVLGEPQILGQVTRALELSRTQDAAGLLLTHLFQSAIHAGKRVRTQTGISRNPASVPSVAANLAVERISNLDNASLVVLGAGEMAELVVEALHKRGANHILVVNRTLERALVLARRWAAETTTFEYLEDSLQKADILITSTSAPDTLIHPDSLRPVMQKRPERPLLIIDIAVPRDVDVAAKAIPGVILYDIDDLRQFLSQALAARQRELPDAQAILRQEKEEFLGFLNSLHLLPLIKDLRRHAEQIRQAELEKTLRKLPELSDAEKKRIEALTEALVNKLLHQPVSRLRAEAQLPCSNQYALVTRSLFGLEGAFLPGDEQPCQAFPDDCPLNVGLDG
jgi:glutamyl-tRNA reductase